MRIEADIVRGTLRQFIGFRSLSRDDRIEIFKNGERSSSKSVTGSDLTDTNLNY